MNWPIRIISIQTGTPVKVSHDGKEYRTGIYKQPVNTPLYLSRTQLEGDSQADLVHHGGPDKAVCVYPQEHYAYWEERLDTPLPPAAFGENLTLVHATEETVCIGDLFAWGEAIVQVSQPRQPCFKLAHRLGHPELPRWVQETGYTGYYLRVIREGQVTLDEFRLLKRHPAGITVATANRVMHHDKSNREAIQRLLAVAELSESWRSTLAKRLAADC